MNKTVYKCCCEKCANCKIIEEKYFSFALGTIDKSYCANAKKVTFENPRECETEIYCKNYKESKDE